MATIAEKVTSIIVDKLGVDVSSIASIASNKNNRSAAQSLG